MKNNAHKFFSVSIWTPDFVALLLRVVFGGLMVYLHGWGKLEGWNEIKNDFAKPFGMSDWWAAALTIFAEVFCCLFIIVGLFTRLASIPVILLMAVAAFNIHAGDPLDGRESAIIYLVAFIAIFLMGSGRWSVDRLVFGKGK
ncbi:MAG: DoxX family protein [Flavobacteriales bacterium]|nr:DoxX family protein [Flavobacteriales bacterium]